MKFCNQCGSQLEWRIPEGDNAHRHVCGECQHIHYLNPKVIVGCLPIWEGHKVLLCKRAIEPRYGAWTVPGGFMENGETVEQGTIRETVEEANATVELGGLHSVYSVPHIGQVFLFFLAELKNLDFYPGVESLEVRLFTEDEIPWEEVAFNSTRFALERFFGDLKNGGTDGTPHMGQFVRGL
ncbi:MAG: NUDIX hydrolase [bacterium]|nr:NUDIX hydrolase [bacterium]